MPGVGDWAHLFVRDLAALAGDRHAIIAIILAPLVGVVCVSAGWFVLKAAGLIDEDMEPLETFALSLGVGLVAIALAWASASSLGTSYYLPLGIGMIVAILPGVRNLRGGSSFPRGKLKTIGAFSVLFVIALSLLGSMSAPSPAAGVQPASIDDHSYWVTLTRGLDQTGTESAWYPSGFDSVPDAPFARSWYHWGELWLGSAADHVPGLTPMFARYLVVMPLVTASAALLAGVFVMRLARERRGFWFGAAAFLFVAPLTFNSPCASCLLPTPFLYHIDWVGLFEVCFLLVAVLLLRFGSRDLRPSATLLLGVLIASLPFLNIGQALLLGAGVAVVLVSRAPGWLRQRRRFTAEWRQTILFTVGLTGVSAAWALATGHGLLNSALSAPVPVAQEVIAWLGASAGILAFLVGAFVLVRKEASPRFKVLLGAAAIPFIGLAAWVMNASRFNAEHFLGGPTLVAPAVGLAALLLADRAKKSGSRVTALAIAGLFAVQAVGGAGIALANYAYDRRDGYAYPQGILAAIDRFPVDSRIAYACAPEGNRVFYEPDLVGISALTGRRVISLCYGYPGLAFGPQDEIYPAPDSQPSPSEIEGFLREHGIRYVYADGLHPVLPVPGLRVIAKDGGSALYEVAAGTPG